MFLHKAIILELTWSRVNDKSNILLEQRSERYKSFWKIQRFSELCGRIILHALNRSLFSMSVSVSGYINMDQTATDTGIRETESTSETTIVSKWSSVRSCIYFARVTVGLIIKMLLGIALFRNTWSKTLWLLWQERSRKAFRLKNLIAVSWKVPRLFRMLII